MVSQLAPYLPCHDGFRLIPAHLLRELCRRHEVGLVAVAAPADTEAQRRWAAAHCAFCHILPPARWRNPLTGRPAAGLEAVRAAVVAAITRFQPDVLHLEGPIVAPLARLGGVPTVHSTHGSRALRARERVRLCQTPWTWLEARLDERLETDWERRWFGAADAIVVPSDTDRAAIARHVGGPIDVIPTGIDVDHYAFRRRGQPDRIVFSGNLAWWPNVAAARHFAIRILPKIRKVRPTTQLVLVGAAPAPAVRALGRVPGVHVAGSVSDIRPNIWAGAVYVSPLRAGFGVKTKVLEAMALGTPIVASARSLTGLGDVLPGHHLLIAERDEEFADAVLMLLREPNIADTIAHNARGLVERRYTWDAVATQYEKVHERVAVTPTTVRVAA